ncbi:MAG: N-acetyl-gamma-glutamyl-phosphate reductase [Bacteroidota bacterium]
MTTVAIIGASGYSGAELVRLLARRADVRLTHLIASSSAGKRFDDMYPAMTGITDIILEPLDYGRLQDTDIAFVALPSGEGMKVVPELLRTVPKVIDLGGDFRLPNVRLYEEFYNHTHLAPSLLTCARYGLPELNRKTIRDARLVANPGCYSTSAILALYPAVASGIISENHIVVNSLSGISGAGRSAKQEMSFTELNENAKAYKIGTHQHTPEMEWALESATSKKVQLSFVPHLIPITRGIYTTIHADLCQNLSSEEVIALYRSYYSNEPFVRVRDQAPQIKHVVQTNYCDIHVVVDARTNQLIITSVIDNLIKGAAGQAIQNLNIMLGVPEQTGLI